ncbi:hypothetical protein EFE24_10100 [Weissella cibaria]|nr:hypothetical protein [Weissella cibaria]MCS8576216.1 hypothetical protein [Weissella cibaria]
MCYIIFIANEGGIRHLLKTLWIKAQVVFICIIMVFGILLQNMRCLKGVTILLLSFAIAVASGLLINLIGWQVKRFFKK